MKRAKNQVGGGKLYILPKQNPTDAAGQARALNLFNKLNASPIDAIKNKLTYWFSDVRGERVTTSDSDIQAVVDTYFAGIEHQDEVFDIVAEILTETYGTDDIIKDAEEINVNKAEAMKYIDDVRQFILFKYPKSVPTPALSGESTNSESTNSDSTNSASTKTDSTKLELIKGSTETLSELLIFPKRLTNVFVQSLANIFILLKNNRDILTQIKTPALKNIAVSEYTANLYSNVWHLTAHEFRDGFFLDQGEDDFKQTMGSFWISLFDTLAELEGMPIENVDLIADTNWAGISTYVFKWYLENKFDDVKDHKESLLMFFKSIAIPDPERKIDDDKDTIGMRDVLPPANCDDVKMFGTTIKELMTLMDNTTLEFILHLAYTIRKNEAATIKAISEA